MRQLNILTTFMTTWTTHTAIKIKCITNSQKSTRSLMRVTTTLTHSMTHTIPMRHIGNLWLMGHQDLLITLSIACNMTMSTMHQFILLLTIQLTLTIRTIQMTTRHTIQLTLPISTMLLTTTHNTMNVTTTIVLDITHLIQRLIIMEISIILHQLITSNTMRLTVPLNTCHLSSRSQTSLDRTLSKDTWNRSNKKNVQDLQGDRDLQAKAGEDVMSPKWCIRMKKPVINSKSFRKKEGEEKVTLPK